MQKACILKEKSCQVNTLAKYIYMKKLSFSSANTAVVTIAAIAAAIAGYLTFFKPSLSSVPASGPLSIEFHRLAGSSAMPYLFKTMEGAIIVPFPAFGPTARRLEDTNGQQFGLLNEEFASIADEFPFSDHVPAITVLWQQFSGSSHARDFAEIINSQNHTDRGVAFEPTARDLICTLEYSELNEDGSGWVSNDVSQHLFGVNKQGLCRVSEYRPYGYFFTAMTIENHSDHVIKDVWLDQREYNYPFDTDSYYRRFTRGCQWVDTENPEAAAECRENENNRDIAADLYFLRYLSTLDASPQTETSRTLGISNIPPGRKIFVLLNVYQPNEMGLPGRFFMSRTEISTIRYRVDGKDYTESEIAPLGDQRLGLVITDNGGVGGQ